MYYTLIFHFNLPYLLLYTTVGGIFIDFSTLVEPDFTIMPSSPLFSRAQSRQSLSQQIHIQPQQQQYVQHHPQSHHKSDNKHSDEQHYGHRSGGVNHVKIAPDKLSNVSGR